MVLAVVLVACGGNVEPAGGDAGAGQAAPAVTVAAIATPDAGGDACVSLEGTACPSGADECACAIRYICDGPSQTLHRATDAESCLFCGGSCNSTPDN